MNILVIGSGAREHTLVWKIKQSPKANKIYCAPGNAGIATLAECVDIAADDITALLKFAQDNHIDLTVVGPEAPLVLGIVDVFEQHGLKIFGPNQAAAQLEGDVYKRQPFSSITKKKAAIRRTANWRPSPRRGANTAVIKHSAAISALNTPRVERPRLALDVYKRQHRSFCRTVCLRKTGPQA